MAALDVWSVVRPRGRVPVAPVPSANERWRERLRCAALTQALRLQAELEAIAATARRAEWPVGGAHGHDTPPGCFVGLEISWVAWVEDGVEHRGPNWSVRHDGAVVAVESAAPLGPTEIANTLARIRICDDLAGAALRKRVYEDEVGLARLGVDNALAFLTDQVTAGPWSGPAR